MASASAGPAREPGREHQVGLGHRQAQRVRARHHGHFGHGLVLDQHALQLERADAVVRGLEHVVGAAHEGDVAVGVARGDVAGVVVAVAHDFARFSPARRGSPPSGPAGVRAGRCRPRLRRPHGRRRRAARCGSPAAAGPSNRASTAGPARCRSARWSRSGRSRRAA